MFIKFKKWNKNIGFLKNDFDKTFSFLLFIWDFIIKNIYK